MYFAGHSYEHDGRQFLQVKRGDDDSDSDVCVQDLVRDLGDGCLFFAVVHGCRTRFPVAAQPSRRPEPRALDMRRRLKPDWLILYPCLSGEDTPDESILTTIFCELLPVPGLPLVELAQEIKRRVPRHRVEVHESIQRRNFRFVAIARQMQTLAQLVLATPIAMPIMLSSVLPYSAPSAQRAREDNKVAGQFMSGLTQDERLMIRIEILLATVSALVMYMVSLRESVRSLWKYRHCDWELIFICGACCSVTASRISCLLMLMFVENYVLEDFMFELGTVALQWISTAFVLWCCVAMRIFVAAVPSAFFAFIYGCQLVEWSSSDDAGDVFYATYVVSSCIMMTFCWSIMGAAHNEYRQNMNRFLVLHMAWVFLFCLHRIFDPDIYGLDATSWGRMWFCWLCFEYLARKIFEALKVMLALRVIGVVRCVSERSGGPLAIPLLLAAEP